MVLHYSQPRGVPGPYKRNNMKKEDIKILVACEESQVVCKAFRELGIEAYSCDLLPCSGGHPEWHIQGDAIKEAYSGKYNAMIAHPPCTFLTNSGVRWLYNKDGSKNKERWENLTDGASFFKALFSSPIPFIAVENPIPHRYAVELIGRKYDQLIQPYHFGHAESKATCLWLKGFPKLQHTNDVKELWRSLPKKEAQRLHYLSPGPERAKLRSKTFEGIAKAIAIQYTNYLLSL